MCAFKFQLVVLLCGGIFVAESKARLSDRFKVPSLDLTDYIDAVPSQDLGTSETVYYSPRPYPGHAGGHHPVPVYYQGYYRRPQQEFIAHVQPVPQSQLVPALTYFTGEYGGRSSGLGSPHSTLHGYGSPHRYGTPHSLRGGRNLGAPHALVSPINLESPHSLGNPLSVGNPHGIGNPHRLEALHNIGVPHHYGSPQRYGIPHSLDGGHNHNIGAPHTLVSPHSLGSPVNFGGPINLGNPISLDGPHPHSLATAHVSYGTDIHHVHPLPHYLG